MTSPRPRKVDFRSTLQSFVDAVPVGIQECNPQGIITLSNAFHCRMHGYEPGELAGKPIWSLVKDTRQRADLPGYLAYLVEHQPRPTPYFSVDIRKDGSEVAVRVDWNYERDDRGRIIGFISAISRCAHPGGCEVCTSTAVKGALLMLQRLETLLAPGNSLETLLVSGRELEQATLSTRERDVLEKLLRGHNPARIADALGISVHTVRNHMKSIYRRFGVHSREALSALFLGRFEERNE